MKKLILSLAALALFMTADYCQAQSGAKIVPTRLRCEYQQEPLGVDAQAPRFSWEFTSSQELPAVGLRQASYRITVDANAQNASEYKGEVWDSGWVESSDMQVAYAGSPLKSDTRYYWVVQVKDHFDRLTGAAGSFTTGLMSQSDWTAKWIGASAPADGQSDLTKATSLDAQTKLRNDPWLRKTFELKEAPQSAQIFIASVGYFELYVNGEQVDPESVLAPNVSNHNYRARYVTYEIGPFLKSGKNVIALWLGNGWAVYNEYNVADAKRPNCPIVMAQTDLKFKNGETQRIVTDSSWKVGKSPNNLCGAWLFGNFGGEHYIVKDENPDWNKVDFDDSAWKNATEFAPNLEVNAQVGLKNIRGREIHAVSVEERDNGVYRVDMGVNFAGWTQITLKDQEPNSTVRFEFSERSQLDMTFNNYSEIELDAQGNGVFRNRFNYSSGRWITVRGLKHAPKPEDFLGWNLRTSYDVVAQCETSNDLLNWIYETGRWTFENLSVGGYVVDCPQRERMGYGGDAHATSESGMYNYALEAFYYKWLQDWRDCQRDFADGWLPNTAPTYWGGGGPSWGGIVITLPYTYYLQYGDKRILEENFEMMSKWLDYLQAHTEDGLLQQYGDAWKFLGDWLWPGAPDGPNSDTPQAHCLNRMYLVFNLKTAAKIARIIGREDAAKEWEARAKVAQDAVNAKYFKADENSYFDDAQAVLGLALLAQLPTDPAVEQKVRERLAKAVFEDSKGHIGAGITGGGLLFRYLRQIDANDMVYSMLNQTEYPGWGFMREHDATTYWEAWELDRPGHSLLHSSYLFPLAWYVSNALGIQRDPEVPAFRQFVVRPPYVNETGLTSAKGYYDSVSGCIEVEWSKKASSFELTVLVPGNTSAVVYAPKPKAGEDANCIVRALTSDDAKEVEKAMQSVTLEQEEDAVKITLPSGKFKIVVSVLR
ncbi:MAG: family 78 glycoside hydrolase catalytic domain [Planctomycetia bacterium]|nr:family 78 glycoside hydrolase catalytic domain [Planctomycetia bacterium]